MAPQPLVSIVTPLYNEVQYLPECIESILGQTYQDWNYTIVDNCSTDGSLEVARRYSARDPRIRIHRNETFLGAIVNHNVAMRQISPNSKYCKLVFGDDWIFPRCLEEMVALAEAHPSIGIVGAYVLEGERTACTGLPVAESVIGGSEVCRRHLLDRVYVFGSANSLLYRADLVRAREPFFCETNIHADTDVCFALLRNSDFGFVHQLLTATRVRPQSLTTASKNLQTYYAGLLQLIVDYGPVCLTPGEYEARRTQLLADYYRFLGKNLLARRDRHFWDYHSREMAKAGVPLSRFRMGKGLAEVLGHAALHPGQTWQRWLQRRHNKLRSRPNRKDATTAAESKYR